MLEIKNPKIAPLFLFMSALLWSTSGIFTKSVEWSGLSLAILKGVIAFFAFLYLARGRKIRITRKKLLAGFCYFVQGTLFMLANKLTTAANATVLENTSPLWIILFGAVLLRKRPSRLECITCACLFLGVALAFALLGGPGAWLCFSLGIKHTSALQANFITMSEPVMAPLWTFIFLGEQLSPMSLVGCAIVIGTLLVYHIKNAQHA